MKELSIFVDESGNFGLSKENSSLYIFTLVIHDNYFDLTKLFNLLTRELKNISDSIEYIHTFSIIRKKDEYKDLDIAKRRKILNVVSHFINNMTINYLCVRVDKKNIKTEDELVSILEKHLERSIKDNLEYFLGFDSLVIYYDNGQKQLRNVLRKIFTKFFRNVLFEVVDPHEYLLFQVADYISTLELIDFKFKNNSINFNEAFFFGSYAKFKRNYYKQIEKKKISN